MSAIWFSISGLSLLSSVYISDTFDNKNSVYYNSFKKELQIDIQKNLHILFFGTFVLGVMALKNLK